MNKPENSLDVEDKIVDIVTDLLRDDITKTEAIDKLLILHNVVGRSEQLKAFAEHLDEMHGGEEFAVNEVEPYLKSL
jgi:hypothetical protein